MHYNMHQYVLITCLCQGITQFSKIAQINMWVSQWLHIGAEAVAYARLSKDIGGSVGIRFYFISQITYGNP